MNLTLKQRPAISYPFEKESIIFINEEETNIEKVYHLTEVGTSVWNLLKHPKSVNEVLVAIIEEYDISLSDAASDITEFLICLILFNLVDIQGGNLLYEKSNTKSNEEA